MDKIIQRCLKIFGGFKHQKKAFKKIIKESIGRINMATGTGKTILASVVALYFLLVNRKKFCVIVVQAPVIILTYQLMLEFVKVFSKVKMDLITLFTHSGSKANNKAWEKIKSDWLAKTKRPMYDSGATLNHEKIKEQFLLGIKYNIPVLVVTTYKSASRLGDILKSLGIVPEVVINDESHYLVSEINSELNDDIEKLTDEDRLKAKDFPGRRKYFFTATELHSDSTDGLGLNNRKRYGRILFRYGTHKAIKDGILCPVVGGVLKISGSVQKIASKKSMGQFIDHSFTQLNKLNKIKNKSVAKILIKANGSKHLKWALEAKQTQDLIATGVNFLVIGSKVGQWINGVSYSDRAEWLEKAQELGTKPDQPMIIVHLQIIAEGFNVPGLNTFVPMAMMSDIKAIQNIGRILRTDKDKKMAIVAVPGFDLFNDAGNKFKKLIEKLSTEYGWPGFDYFDDLLDPSVDGDDHNELQIPNKTKRNTNPFGENIDDIKFSIWQKKKHKTKVSKIKSLAGLYGS